jgi:hypothetical protein
MPENPESCCRFWLGFQPIRVGGALVAFFRLRPDDRLKFPRVLAEKVNATPLAGQNATFDRFPAGLSVS